MTTPKPSLDPTHSPPMDSTSAARASIERVELPKMDPISLFRKFGPGLILMMTGVGTSHLVTAPVAGGRYEYLLLWSIPVAYIIKYYGFQMAFRFTNATGYSIMDAMASTKGKWGVWYIVVANVLQASLGMAGRLSAAAAVLFFMGTTFGGLGFAFPVYAVIGAIAMAGLVLAGRYGALENVTKLFVILLSLSATYVFFAKPPPIEAYAFFLQFQIPVGSMLVLGAFLGLLPTGIDVAVQSSEWGKAKKAGLPVLRPTLEKLGLAKRVDPFVPFKLEDMSVRLHDLPEQTQEYVRRWFKIGNYDFAFGHWLSMILAIFFLMLAAVWMYPSPVSGTAVMGDIARIFTSSIGPHMMWIFLIGAMAALVSTVINYFDGIPRVIAASARNLWKPVAELKGIDDPTPEARRTWYSEYNIWRMMVVFSAVTSVLLIVAIPRPVFMVLIASVLALAIAPVLFFFNFWFCLKAIPKEDTVFYPTPLIQVFTWVTLVVFSGASILVVWQEVSRAFGW